MPTKQIYFGEERALISTWRKMISRCRNPKDRNFSRYGGRGITVLEDWVSGRDGQTGLNVFFQHVGKKPGPDYSIDRIDNDKGYEPGNVRWASAIQQANNKSVNRLVTYQGEIITISQAVRAAGSVVAATLAHRRISANWPIEEAIETPPLYRMEPGTRRIIGGKRVFRKAIRLRKLTLQQAADLASRYRSGGNLKVLAKEFGVSPATVWRISSHTDEINEALTPMKMAAE